MDRTEEATQRARELLHRILPLNERTRLRTQGVVEVIGASGRRYRIAPYAQTEIFRRSGRPKHFACLQLTVPAPAYDRMIAEYLLIRNDEALYCEKANLFARALLAVCIGLACSLLADLILLLR